MANKNITQQTNSIPCMSPDERESNNSLLSSSSSTNFVPQSQELPQISNVPPSQQKICSKRNQRDEVYVGCDEVVACSPPEGKCPAAKKSRVETTQRIEIPYFALLPSLDDLRLDKLLHYLTKEIFLRSRVGFGLASQPHFKASERANIVSRLIQMGIHLRLGDQTIHLAVQIIDRVAETHVIGCEYLPLMVTALHISAKYNESLQSCPPLAAYAEYLQRQPHFRQQIIALESQVLNLLSFEFGFPTTVMFAMLWIDLVSNNNNNNNQDTSSNHTTTPTLPTTLNATQKSQLTKMARLVCELSLFDVNLLNCRPSEIATAALLLSSRLLAIQIDWTSSIGPIPTDEHSPVLRCLQVLDTLTRQLQTTEVFTPLRNKHREMAEVVLQAF